MGLTVTRYKAESQRVSVAGSRRPIYEVPAGKVAKIQFQLGSGGASTAWHYHQQRGMLATPDSNSRSLNSITCVGGGRGAALWVGDVRVLSTPDASYGNSDRWSLSLLQTDQAGMMIVPTYPNGSPAEPAQMKNDFILLAGERVSFSASDQYNVLFYYNFIVYEEDI